MQLIMRIPFHTSIPSDSLRQATIEKHGLPATYVPEEPSVFESFLGWFGSLFGKILGAMFGQTGSLLATVVVWLFVASIIYLLVKVGAPYYKRYVALKDVTINYEEGVFISEVSLADSLAAYEESGDLEHALRIRYVMMLRALESISQIEIAPAKTSRQYAREISDDVKRDGFKNITASFNEFVYGSSVLSQSAYQDLAQQMQGVART